MRALSAHGTDRPEQYAREAAVTAAADDQHLRTHALFDENVRRIALDGGGREPLWTLRPEDRLCCATENRVGALERAEQVLQQTEA